MSVFGAGDAHLANLERQAEPCGGALGARVEQVARMCSGRLGRSGDTGRMPAFQRSSSAEPSHAHRPRAAADDDGTHPWNANWATNRSSTTPRPEFSEVGGLVEHRACSSPLGQRERRDLRVLAGDVPATDDAGERELRREPDGHRARAGQGGAEGAVEQHLNDIAGLEAELKAASPPADGVAREEKHGSDGDRVVALGRTGDEAGSSTWSPNASEFASATASRRGG
jgi:hypothetical protein